jgi:hypothetical protein
MKITFLGVSGALSTEYNSNMLIEYKDRCVLFDCGEDVMHSLNAAKHKPEEITDVFISHLHFDHCGGLSWLGYYSYFVTLKKIRLCIHESMVSDLWAMLRPAMEKLDGVDKMMTLDDYFEVRVFKDKDPISFGDFFFKPIRQLHVETPYGNMYSYGVVIDWSWSVKGHKRAFISSDTKKPVVPFGGSFGTIAFCDCDVLNLGGVHPNYDDLKKIDYDTRSITWLYHYHDLGKDMPDAVKDGFAGFVKEGQVFEI